MASINRLECMATDLEVEAHIITAASTSLDNLEQCVNAAGAEVEAFVLNPLASAEAVLTDTEREMGVVVCDIGGGTTDLAIYINGDVWHTMVMSIGGNLITSDITHGLSLSMDQAEKVKIEHGHAMRSEVNEDEVFHIRPFGDDAQVEYLRRDLALIIEARVEELFSYVIQEIKRSGYDGLLPAGMVLTGGTSSLPGISQFARNMFRFPGQGCSARELVRYDGSALQSCIFNQCWFTRLDGVNEYDLL